MCEAETGNIKEANACWVKGLLCTGEDEVRSECAENLAVAAARTNDQATAAYLVKWANAMRAARPDRAATRTQIYQSAVNVLSEEQVRYLSTKSSDFSFADLARFRSGSIRTGTAAAPSPVPSSRVPSQGASGKSTTVPRGLFDQALVGAPEPPPDGLKKKIPEIAADCRPAHGGIYLVLKFREMRKLGIFNIARAEFAKYLPLANPDSPYACGGKWLVVFDPTQKLFELYDMTTLERAATKMSRLDGTLTDIEMGLMTSDKAVVSWANGTGALDRRQYGMMTIPEMAVTLFQSTSQDYAQGFRNGSYRDNIHIRLDHTATRFVSWCTSHSPSGFICGSIDGASITTRYEHNDAGALSLLPDRSRVVASCGRLLDSEGSTRHDFKQSGCLLFAVDGANLLLKVVGDQVVVVDAINLTELQSFTLPFKMKSLSWNKDKLTTDRLVFASSYLNRAAFLDNASQQIAVFKLAGGSSAAVIAEQIEGVRAGTKWSRTLEHPDGTRVKVEDAPAGVAYDATKKVLTWEIPRDTAAGSYQVLISVTAPGKEEVYERVAITVR